MQRNILEFINFSLFSLLTYISSYVWVCFKLPKRLSMLWWHSEKDPKKEEEAKKNRERENCALIGLCVENIFFSSEKSRRHFWRLDCVSIRIEFAYFANLNFFFFPHFLFLFFFYFFSFFFTFLFFFFISFSSVWCFFLVFFFILNRLFSSDSRAFSLWVFLFEMIFVWKWLLCDDFYCLLNQW